MFDSDGGLDSLFPGTTLSEIFPMEFENSAGPDHFDNSVPASMRPSFATMEQRLEHDTIGNLNCEPPPNGNGMSFTGSTNHDCYREAHEMLGSLLATDSMSGWKRRRGEETPPKGGPFMLHSRLHGQMTLDQLLLLNGKAIERLSFLLTCPCAGSPHIMMLYASCISAILSRYQHAAGSASSSSRPSPTWEPSPTTSSDPSPTDTWDPLSLHRASGGITDGTRSAGLTGGGAVAPARIWIGVFSVDDPRVQSALNIRLLASEVRRVIGLIDQIAAYHSGGPLTFLGGEPSGGHTDGMYQSLTMWLRGEHSRVIDFIRNRLGELEI